MSLHAHPNAPPDVSRLDLYSAAFLAGGPARVADVAALAMRATGVLHISRDGTVTATGREPADPVTAGVLRAVRDAGGSTSLATLRYLGARCPEVQGIGHQLYAWGLLRAPGTTAQVMSSRMRMAVGFGGALVALLVLAIALQEPGFFLGVVILVMVFFFVVAGRAGELLVDTGPNGQRRPSGHTRLGVRYVVQLRSQGALRSRLDGTVAGGFGLGEIAVLGLARLTDYELLDVFRQQQVAATMLPQNTATTSGSSSCAAYYAAAPSWCGSASCADGSFRGTSCSGPNSGAWSCSPGGSSSCGGGGGSSCGGSSGGSSCGGGGGGGCGGGGGS